MKKIFSIVWALLLWAVLLPAARAGDPPTFNVSFDPAATYIKTNRGTEQGVKNDYLGPAATSGVLYDKFDKKVGEFVNVHATEFDAILQVTSLVDGRSLSDASYLAMPGSSAAHSLPSAWRIPQPTSKSTRERPKSTPMC